MSGAAHVRPHFADSLLVTFTPEALDLVAAVNAAAIARTVHMDNRSRRDLTKTQTEANRIGLMGEYAVAWCEGLSIWRCGIANNGRAMDGGADVTRVDGRTIQVKAVAARTNAARVLEQFWWTLEGTDPAELTADYGVMAYVFPDQTVCLYGFFARADFIANATVRDLGTGERLGMRAADLRPMAEWEWSRTCGPICRVLHGEFERLDRERVA